MKQNGFALEHASVDMKNNKEVVLAAVKEAGLALEHASVDMKNNKEVVLAAVKQNGLALEHASVDMKNNKEVVLAAVQNNGAMLEHASDQMKNNLRVVLAAGNENLRKYSNPNKLIVFDWIVDALTTIEELSADLSVAIIKKLEKADFEYLKEAHPVIVEIILKFILANIKEKGEFEKSRQAMVHKLLETNEQNLMKSHRQEVESLRKDYKDNWYDFVNEELILTT